MPQIHLVLHLPKCLLLRYIFSFDYDKVGNTKYKHKEISKWLSIPAGKWEFETVERNFESFCRQLDSLQVFPKFYQKSFEFATLAKF